MNHEQTTTTNELPAGEDGGLEPDQPESPAIAAEHVDRRERARQRWLEVLRPDAAQAARFDEIYLGDHASLKAYGLALAESCGWREQIAQVVPDVALANLQLDYEGIVCDLWMGGQVRIIDHAEGMWLYRRHLEVATEPEAGATGKSNEEGGEIHGTTTATT